LPCFGGKNASCNGHKNHEIECVVASWICNNCVYQFWSLDVQKCIMDTFAIIIIYLNDS
jgi:hypothetical protein